MDRDAGGRFARTPSPPESSGSRLPRTITAREASLIIRDVANLPVVIRDASRRRRVVSFFEAAVWQIATGQVTRRNSPIQFVRLAREDARNWPADDAPGTSCRSGGSGNEPDWTR